MHISATWSSNLALLSPSLQSKIPFWFEYVMISSCPGYPSVHLIERVEDKMNLGYKLKFSIIIPSFLQYPCTCVLPSSKFHVAFVSCRLPSVSITLPQWSVLVRHPWNPYPRFHWIGAPWGTWHTVYPALPATPKRSWHFLVMKKRNCIHPSAEIVRLTLLRYTFQPSFRAIANRPATVKVCKVIFYYLVLPARFAWGVPNEERAFNCRSCAAASWAAVGTCPVFRQDEGHR